MDDPRRRILPKGVYGVIYIMIRGAYRHIIIKLAGEGPGNGGGCGGSSDSSGGGDDSGGCGDACGDTVSGALEGSSVLCLLFCVGVIRCVSL